MLSAVVLPERGAMNAVMVSSQDANRAGPRPAGRLRSPSSSPVSAAGSDRGLAPASDGRSLMAVFAAGTGVSGVICGLPASAATGSPGLRDARGDDPPRDGPGRDDRARQHGGDQRDQDGGRAGPCLAGTPAGQADDPPFAERGHAPPGQGCGDAGGEPGQPGRSRQAPADQQHHPDPGAVAGQERHPRACRPGHDPSPRAGPALRGRAARPREVAPLSTRRGVFRGRPGRRLVVSMAGQSWRHGHRCSHRFSRVRLARVPGTGAWVVTRPGRGGMAGPTSGVGERGAAGWPGGSSVREVLCGHVLLGAGARRAGRGAE